MPDEEENPKATKVGPSHTQNHREREHLVGGTCYETNCPPRPENSPVLFGPTRSSAFSDVGDILPHGTKAVGK